MKNSFKNTLLTVTILSVGAAFFPRSLDAAAVSPIENKKKYSANKDFQQDKDVLLVRSENDKASSAHKQVRDLPGLREEIRKNREQIERYEEIVRRLNQNTSCNLGFLTAHFTDGPVVWEKISAYAEETAQVALAEANDSLAEDSAELTKDAKYQEANADQIAADGDAGVAQGIADSAGGIGDTTTYGEQSSTEANDSALSDSLNGQSQQESELEAEMNAKNASSGYGEADPDKMRAYARIRWDIGTKVLKELYAQPKLWGTPKSKYMFNPWKDQKYIYDAYLLERYTYPEKDTPVAAKAKKKKIEKLLKKIKDLKSYLPEINSEDDVLWRKEIEETEVAEKEKDPEKQKEEEKKKEEEQKKKEEDPTYNAVDEKWCGEGYECVRVSKGPLFDLHKKILALVGEKESIAEPPYLPADPLPPWQETTFMLDDDFSKAVLQDPWIKILLDPELLKEDGEFANLVVESKFTPFKKPACGKDVKICLDPERYDYEEDKPKKNKKGEPLMKMPLEVNRISAYLALKSFKEESEPQKIKAEENIREIKAALAKKLKELGDTAELSSEALDLENDGAYNALKGRLGSLQTKHLDAATAQIQAMRGKYGKLREEIKKILTTEEGFRKAMEKDSAFLLDIARGNYKNVDSDLKTAAADDEAEKVYKANMEKKDDGEELPPVGCPVL